MDKQDMRARAGPGLSTLLWVALVAGLAIVALMVWQGVKEKREREAALGAMVTAFQKQNSLSVFRAQVPVFVRNSDSRLFGILRSEQVGVIPATIDYRLDLAKLDPSSFRWNEENQTMAVTIPPLTIGRPSLDAERAQLVNKGILVTGEAAMNLMRKNMGTARTSAAREARNPQMLALARAAAREMMIQNITLPLRAAGYDEARVSVRFADEAEPDASYIDHSRSYNEVLEERQRQPQGSR